MNTLRFLPVLALSSIASTVACDSSTVDADEANATSRTTYVELGDFIENDTDLEMWIEIRRGLLNGFDEVCGDTFCEGDFTNLTALDFTCSVTKKRGKVRECAWTIAASDEVVRAADGTVAASVPFFVCRVRPTGYTREFLSALASDPLHARAPGLSGSLVDALGDCFEAPIGGATLPAPGEGRFVDAADGLEGDDVDAWFAMTRGLATDFDERCGDTFCEGDFTNLASLRIKCSENLDTGKIGRCAWSFAGSDASPKSDGLLKVTRDATTCTFTADATPHELAVALSPDADGESPLMRTLPGTNATIFDALVDCL